MQENIIRNIITYIKENWGSLLLKTFLAIGVFIIGYIIIQQIVIKIKNKIYDKLKSK